MLPAVVPDAVSDVVLDVVLDAVPDAVPDVVPVAVPYADPIEVSGITVAVVVLPGGVAASLAAPVADMRVLAGAGTGVGLLLHAPDNKTANNIIEQIINFFINNALSNGYSFLYHINEKK
jgi:hypothetical protein